MMAKLTRFVEAEPRIKVGDLVAHTDHPEFRGKVVGTDNGRCMVEVLSGWRGPQPTWSVGMPAWKLEVVG